jgi:membrane protease YdiL (CAAX protease family)
VKGRNGILVILVAYLLVRAFWIALDQGGRALDSVLAPGLLKIALWVVPCLLIASAADRIGLRAVLREFGLAQGLRAGLIFGVLATLPLAAAVLIVGAQGPGIAELVSVSILDPIGESVLFSGFVYSQLVRWRWRAGSALTVSALLFGAAHSDGGELAVLATAYRGSLGLGFDLFWNELRRFIPSLVAVSAAGLLFTWLLARWGSLWPTIALHAGINFWWTLSADRAPFIQSLWDTVTVTGIGHGLSMALAVLGTLFWSRRVGRPSRAERPTP